MQERSAAAGLKVENRRLYFSINFVKTNPNLGLGPEDEHADKAIEILNEKD